MVDDTLRAAVDTWLADDPDPVTRAELHALVDAGRWDALADRFSGRLAFGTAGLRAEMGAGPLRMNRLVVRQAAAGLVDHLHAQLGRPPRIVVGFDARHGSEVFASDTARVAAAAGATVDLFERHGPTPLLAYAVRALGADAGVMVTASHNPPRDNGLKVYLGDGAQIVPPVDGAIAAAIARAAAAGTPDLAPPDSAAVRRDVHARVVEGYLDAIVGLTALPGARDLDAVYTPMHGVGLDLFLAAYRRAGFGEPVVVAAQAEPDPDFPTVVFPNPEEPGALDLALAEAERVGADVVLANDPDADRLGVAVPDDGRWRALTGNEIGALLADHLLRHRPAPGERLVVTTVVSSRLLSRMAFAHRAHHAETLTGFKWIVRPALAHPEWTFTFGYEEALGYSVGPVVWDKDGISAALVFAELVAALRATGSSPARRLEELARAYGLHATRGWSLRFGSVTAGATEATRVMRSLRAHPEDEVDGVAVVGRRDLLAEGGPEATDALIWDLADGARLTFRPSGTEPKLKVYLEVVEPVAAGAAAYVEARARAERRLDGLAAAVEAQVIAGA